MKSIALIGSAGRGKDAERLDRDLYDAMYREALATVREHDIEEAVSGGAAFADHTAVRLFLEGEVKSLRLYLPAVFDGRAFVPNARIASNPGKTANHHHQDFKASCGVDGLKEIAEAISRGAKIEVFQGFKRRNLEVAGKCTHMQAFTFGTKPTGIFMPEDAGFLSHEVAGLKDGGTAHTWGECWKARWKKHVSLFDL
ncbi:hypothetical protein HFO56_24545 [Rhizobium laguerreae]|uniref:hypothetical protein n=1 Tax=Rhizobium laguerreae TaxID=1076926 RepID=UPI001C8FAD95|nr:hypothetical protein [Rhizobium laguerreae]MBY3155500.1 hypothetical protein [Rhizobium laguerreae]